MTPFLDLEILEKYASDLAGTADDSLTSICYVRPREGKIATANHPSHSLRIP